MIKALAGLALSLCLGAFPFAARAGGIDLSLSNETANIVFLLNPAPVGFRAASGSELKLGGFISEEDDRLLHASLMAKGHRTTTASMYSLAAGAKAIGGDVAIEDDRVLPGAEDTERVGALALGFEVGLVSGAQRNVDFKVGAFYAPSISSFSDAENFTELTARLQVAVIPTASAYVGYRRMGFDTNDYDNVRLDRSVHVGLELVY